MRCLRCAGAPRRPAGGSELSLSILSRHAALSDPGEFDHRKSRASMTTWPSPRSERLGTPNPPAIRFARGTYFGASRFTHLLRPASSLAPLYGSDRYARPPGAFTSRLSTARSPSPFLDITTTATGLLCWRDFHPQEWQLASLHLLLHRRGLAPPTPCRSPGALRVLHTQPGSRVSVRYVRSPKGLRLVAAASS